MDGRVARAEASEVDRDAGVTRQRAFVIAAPPGAEGASLVARALVDLGASKPRTPLRQGEGEGSEERMASKPVRKLHEDALASAGTRWDGILPLSQAWYSTPDAAAHRKRIASAVEMEFVGSMLFVIDDPLACRLIPLWADILADLEVDAGFVLPVENPFTTAAFLERQHGIVVGKGLMLWLRYMFDAEQHTRELPRTFIACEDARRNPESAGRAVFEAFGVTPLVNEVDTVGQGENDAPRQSLAQVESETGTGELSGAFRWARDAYEALLEACRSDGSTATIERLDAVGAAVSEIHDAYGPALADARLETLAAEQRAVVRSRHLYTSEVARLKARLEERERTVTALKGQIASIESSVSWRITKPIRSAKALIKRLLRRGSSRPEAG